MSGLTSARCGGWRAANPARVACVLLVPALLLASGCKPQAPEAAAAPQAPLVTVAHPLVSDLVQYDDFTGTTEASQTVEIRPRVTGYLEKVNFKAGSLVKVGDVLYQIDPRPYQAKLDQAIANLAVKKAQAEQAVWEFKRMDGLYRKVPPQASEFEHAKARTTMDAAKAAVEQAQAEVEDAQLNLGYTTIHAPINGRISRTLVDVGNLVGAAGDPTLLTTIVNITPMYVYFACNEQALLRYRRAARESPAPDDEDLRVALGLVDSTGFPYQGTFDFGESRVDPGTGTLMVRAVFPNTDGELLPGLFARLRIATDLRKGVLLVPEEALNSGQGGKFVLVVDQKDNQWIVSEVTVETGQLQSGYREVRARQGDQKTQRALAPTDWVVVNGLQSARAGRAVRIEESVLAPLPTPAPPPASGPASSPATTPASAPAP